MLIILQAYLILCGFGAVGQSLASLFESRAKELYEMHGLRPRIVGVFDSKGAAFQSSGLDPGKLVSVKKSKGTVGAYGEKTTGGLDMIESVDADVLVETTASNYKDAEPGMSHIMAAMRRGMHVISVNKGPLALAFPSLLELAEHNGVKLRFSGTVGGGTPILDYAKNSLHGEKITSFSGILNGTTNYILTNMSGGMSFNDALSDAKGKGYVRVFDLDGLMLLDQSTDISTGATRSPPLHDATSFMAELFFSAAFTFGISILRIPVLSISCKVTRISIIQFASIVSFDQDLKTRQLPRNLFPLHQIVHH